MASACACTITATRRPRSKSRRNQAQRLALSASPQQPALPSAMQQQQAQSRCCVSVRSLRLTHGAAVFSLSSRSAHPDARRCERAGAGACREHTASQSRSPSPSRLLLTRMPTQPPRDAVSRLEAQRCLALEAQQLPPNMPQSPCCFHSSPVATCSSDGQL